MDMNLPTEVPWEHAHRMDAFTQPDCTGMAPGPRRQRDADRRRQARADGHGVVNDMVALCRSGTRQQAADRALFAKQGYQQAPAPQPVRRRWGAFLLQNGRGRLTTAQARSLRRRSTRHELMGLTAAEWRMIGLGELS